MAKPHQRFFALVIAVLFFATSVATGAAVIWQINKEKQQQASLENGELGNDQSDINQPKSEEDMLQGTKLENFEPVDNIEELTVKDLKEGDGEVVKKGAEVTAHYTGAIASTGEIFQSSHDMGQPIPFGLDQVIAGWTEGVPGMKVGGIRRLLIPYEKAYGEQGNPPSIPAKADLVFDIEVVEVKNP